MVARAHTFTLDGALTRHVTVEVDVRAGLPTFTIIGLGDTAVREARERVRAAILNSGLEFPSRRITANLAPADLPKAGPGLDLALACALLAASAQIPCERLERRVLLGELALDGAVRPCAGTLAIAQAARRMGFEGLTLAGRHAGQAELVAGLAVTVVEGLSSAVRVLSGGDGDRRSPAAAAGGSARPRAGPPALDLADVRGQQHAVQALIVAAAGGHNLLMSGPPGTGKTMLALRLPTILAPMSTAEALAVTRIEGLAGTPSPNLAEQRPFRRPHHSITPAGLLGGARAGSVGEVVRAHNGVLFLDELAEFSRSALQCLRQPLEEGRVAISRASRTAIHPARFMLVAATNPCPCGFAGAVERCACSEGELARYRRRLGGALLDRIDLHVDLEPDGCAAGSGSSRCSSADARGRVLAARAFQARRSGRPGGLCNGRLDAGTLSGELHLESAAERLLARAGASGLISARGRQRAQRVARTLADLRGDARVRAEDVGGALAMRRTIALPRAHGISRAQAHER